MNGQVFLDRISNEPMFLEPRGANLFASSVQAFFQEHKELAERAFQAETASVDDPNDDFWNDEYFSRYRPYNVTAEGILTVPVAGVLVNKFPFQVGSWITGYEYIEAAVKRGVADANVKGIALVIDSPGGMVAGNFELSDFIYSMREEKPIRAFAYDHAYSAAYSLASAAEHISITRSGGVGSIGVVTMHVNQEKFLDKLGIEITFIYAGKHKVEGNSYEKLSGEAKDRIQARIDKLYNIFSSTVARNRGIEDSAVKATEALTYDSEDAISVNLADSVGVFAEEFARFSNEITEGYSMSKQDQTVEAGVSVESHEAAVASARSEGMTVGAQQERQRISAIMALEESAERPTASVSVALKTGMSVEEAKTFLAGLPTEKKEEAKQSPNHFETAMANGNPEVGSGEVAAATEENPTDRIKAAYRGATGLKK